MSWGRGSRCSPQDPHPTSHGLRSGRKLCPAFRSPPCQPLAPAAGDTWPSVSKVGTRLHQAGVGVSQGWGSGPGGASACASTSHTPGRGATLREVTVRTCMALLRQRVRAGRQAPSAGAAACRAARDTRELCRPRRLRQSQPPRGPRWAGGGGQACSRSLSSDRDRGRAHRMPGAGVARPSGA